MSNKGRAPTSPTTTREQQRQSSTGHHGSAMSTSSSPAQQRQTTFITQDPTGKRAPSTYHVDTTGGQIGDSQRARQQHKSGPTVTKQKNAVHAFTDSKRMQKAVSKITKDMVNANPSLNPQQALRLNIMDGLASPTATQGAQHIEAFNSKLGKGNPHRSGGTVTFPQSGSTLANFDTVSANTKQMKREVNSSHKTAAPITDTTTSNPASAQQFNSANMRAQHAFAQSILNPGKK